MQTNEHNLWQFWRQINQVYFRKVDELELDKIKQIRLKLDQPFQKIQVAKYSDFTSYFDVRSAVNKQIIMSRIEKRDLASLYYKTVLKHIKLSNLIYNAYEYNNVDYGRLSAIYIRKQKYVSKVKSTQLLEENRQLDLLICRVEKLTDQLPNDEIEEEVERLEEEFYEFSRANKAGMLKLQAKFELSMKQQGQVILIPQNPVFKRKGRRRKSKSLDTSEGAVLEVQKEFLRSTILKLEQRQVADSITKVVSVQMQNKQTYSFQVAFEQALNSNYQTLNEDTLQELDKLRDLSLFRFFNIPQKTRYSHIAQNFYGIHHVIQNRLKPNNLNHRNLLPLLKKQALQNIISDSVTIKFDCCHNCRMLFKEENLMSCNYRSGTMGLPIINSTMTDPNIYLQLDNEHPCSKRQVPSRKRNTYSMYARKNGELVCKRRFCRQCLKQCYDFNVAETLNRNDWVCPFCQGICYCTRCQRNDILNKLKSMYTLIGGNIQEIQDSSLLEQFVKPRDDEFFYKKKSSRQQGFQRTGYSFFRQQFTKFKSMQEVRLDFENMRSLCSIIMKREKLKLKFRQTEYELWLCSKGTPDDIVVKEEYEESVPSPLIKPVKISKAKQKFEQQQRLRLEKTKKLIEQYFPRVSYNPNSAPDYMPQIKLKRELQQLILTQDRETYNLVVKKIKKDDQ